MNSPELKGKTALVTGSTSGIGKVIGQKLAAAGCHIGLHGLDDPATAAALRDELATEYGVRVFCHGADLTKPAEIPGLIEDTVRELGPIDILVNNAGAQFVASIEELPLERWDALLALNLSAPFHTTRAVLGGMRARHWGRIVNMASVHGLVASIHKSAYVAAKHGLVGLTKVTALEAARDGITCNAICPGFVQTPLVDRQIDHLAKVAGRPREEIVDEVILSKHPTRTFVRVDQVADYVCFLCSDAASAITGAALTMDGGWTAI